MELPRSLDWMHKSEPGRAWLRTLPATVDALGARWGLRLGKPFAGSYVSLVLPAVESSGRPAVLKIQYPDRESAYEADALRIWGGEGAVRLYQYDAELHALLLERCEPGIALTTSGPTIGLDVLINLLPRLWLPAPNEFGTVADEARRWATNLPEEWESAGEPFAAALLDDVIATLRDLAGSQGEQVLVHQDLHGGNVLSAQREPWLAIDPKPLIGEREFGLSPIIRSAEFGHSRESVIHRLDRLTGDLGLNRDRARLWAAGQAVAWGFENGAVLPGHIETARWLLAG